MLVRKVASLVEALKTRYTLYSRGPCVSQGGNALTVTQSRFSVASRSQPAGGPREGRRKQISLRSRFAIPFRPLRVSLSFARPPSHSVSPDRRVSFWLSPALLSLHRNIPFPLCLVYLRPPRSHRHGCRPRMQRYMPATRCIDDDSAANCGARSLLTCRNNFALVSLSVLRDVHPLPLSTLGPCIFVFGLPVNGTDGVEPLCCDVSDTLHGVTSFLLGSWGS